MRQNSRGWYCATKLEDGSWCKYKPQSSNYQNTAASTTLRQPSNGRIEALPRNFDREAYEKCCSIWAQGRPVDEAVERIESGAFWKLFQSIRKDGEKRFATGWAKAEAVFKQAPSDDYEAGNKAIEEAQAETQEEGWYEAS